MKRAFIVHGWEGWPGEGWFPWLQRELEVRGFAVQVPAMPDSAHPRIEGWVAHLAEVVGAAGTQDFFIGHSIGCQTILRWLERSGARIGGAVLVAPWFHLVNLRSAGEEAIARPWLETPLDTERVREQARFVAVFSDNDPLVPLSEEAAFAQRLGARTVVEHAKGHFSGSDGVTELPAARDAVLQLAAEG